MKPGKNLSELCYSFIYDVSWLTDYEVATDELSAQIGMACSGAEAEEDRLRDLRPEIVPDLERLQALALHANGSLRGRAAIEEADLEWLHERYARHSAAIEAAEPERLKTFVLPRGRAPVPDLHAARASAKKALRCLVRLEAETPGVVIPPEIPRFLNLLCNFVFVLAVRVNQARGVCEPTFISRSYRVGRTGKK
ncbi:MAG: ATP:cob(I)alamin adenosyltransferase [Zoogloeaceae bacterium]|jgi:cob(I)alamin adenosyltransferase|nr:ATP:cob(I)alamin adenosyltransferase [Zoogloeaceae bacterium]